MHCSLATYFSRIKHSATVQSKELTSSALSCFAVLAAEETWNAQQKEVKASPA